MGVVYVLTNPVMPELVKIGKTENDDANARIGQLYTTGVPLPFKLEFAGRVADVTQVESALHVAFAPYRLNPKREFFRIQPEQAIAILKLLHVEDDTRLIEESFSGVDAESLEAARQAEARRPVFNFHKMGIATGSLISFTRGDATAVVVGQRKVRYGDEDSYLTALTRQLLGVEYDVQPGRFWTFGGRLLTDVYEDAFGTTDVSPETPSEAYKNISQVKAGR